MSFETAKKCIDWIFHNIPKEYEGVELDFIGGEPLLEFNLIKQIFTYVKTTYPSEKVIFYATTNGTVLTPEIMEWYTQRKSCCVLGLSLDGKKETQDHNRSNSFDKINLDFFLKNWPWQGIKMTLTEFSLDHLADNIIYCHELGFSEVGGVNLFEGTFDWSDEKWIQKLIPQLKILVDYYVEHDEVKINQMLNRHLEACEFSDRKEKHRWCGIGDGAIFFDIDGRKLPCTFCTPMTFDEKTLNEICNHDFSKVDDFIDDECYNSCYIYPICPHCAGANYMTQKTFKTRDKSKCRIQKLISLFAADLLTKRILKNPEKFEEYKRGLIIDAIQKIRELYMPEFRQYFEEE
jgi:sulfatase maturation enzyme AslB (radical SAM superfamily)